MNNDATDHYVKPPLVAQELEDAAKELYATMHMQDVEDGVESHFLPWHDVTEGVRDEYRHKVLCDPEWKFLSRRGLDSLLAKFPSADVIELWNQKSFDPRDLEGYWLCVTLRFYDSENRCYSDRRYAIWLRTGNVYRVDDFGAAEDDPYIEVTSSD